MDLGKVDLAHKMFILKQVIKRRRKSNLETCLAFIDSEKVFDEVDQTIIWNIIKGI
jgi:hypothetical protein